ncbi:hypothetical protein LTS07_011450 [Exophiala sideris]|uniref:Uncharacterized protein n=1 Tax=Exophiala sideris TaxID=1016849 RepID=A0ABR0IUU6_9EURO|nr:hypothetical protein LTS07_011450 [Exophiala sideris]KAK5048112.1 hypothetical protein LTR69_011456 [Exophiala sideris]
MKGKKWISLVGIGGDELARRSATSGNCGIYEVSTEDRKRYHAGATGGLLRHEEKKQFHVMSKKFMEDKLVGRPDILNAVMPDWSPGCRRLTPGPGYLEACCEPNVDYIFTPIKRVHTDSIETEDGKKRKVDVIICATGFDVSHRSGPKITGLGGRDLHDIWYPTPEAYMSMCPPSMPNLFIYFGPNGGPLTGSTILMLEWVCDYAIASIQKLQREFLKSMVVKSSAAKAFSTYVNKFFAKTVFIQPRGTKDGRVVANWPGSGVHSRKALMNPRWEDFDYEMMQETEDKPLSWLGNGMTVGQRERTDVTDYLDQEQTINKPVPLNTDVSVESIQPASHQS